MDKRYQVFVSSTYMDLVEERLEVIKALLELDCIPCGMEYFPAASEESWSYIASLIDQCDYYVVIVGGRYGSTTEEGISFTEKSTRTLCQKEFRRSHFSTRIRKTCLRKRQNNRRKAASAYLNLLHC